MSHTDKRNRLDEAVFNYRLTKDNSVLIDYYGKQVKIIKGKAALKFIAKLSQAANHKEEQLVMAKITGNFKRGNEK